jgi:hypothetical protein
VAAWGPGALVETPQKHPNRIPESNPLPPERVDIHRSDCSYGLFLVGPTGPGYFSERDGFHGYGSDIALPPRGHPEPAMPLSKLPPLPAIRVRPEQPFRRVLLADILVRLRECDPLPLSRRDLAEAYNRSGGSRVSKHLRMLVGDGWLSLAKQSQGKKAHCYSHGWRLRQNPGLGSEWEALGDALWGSEGLLSVFKDSAAFGYGMIGESRLICLGALIRSQEPMTKTQLSSYVRVLMGATAVSDALDALERDGLVEKTDDGFITMTGRESTLHELVESSPPGRQRQQRNSERHAEERAMFAKRLRDGGITDLQLLELKKLPCVMCGGRSSQKEHFPPRKYKDSDRIHSLWAICKPCNNRTSSFIRALPAKDEIPPPKVEEFYWVPGIDPGDLLQASMEFRLRRFYQASENGDLDEAVRAIRMALSIYNHMEERGLLTTERIPETKRSRGQRTLKGSARPLSGSRLPY